MTKNDRPLNLILIEDYLKQKNINTGDVILKADIVKWVENNYRGDNSYARNTINNWIRRMSTNDPGRLNWGIKKGLDDVFFVIEGSKKQIRLYDPENDPTPIYKNDEDLLEIIHRRDEKKFHDNELKLKQYLPTKDDCDRAVKELYNEGKEGKTIQVFDRIEKNITSQGFILKSNWRIITEENMKIWSH